MSCEVLLSLLFYFNGVDFITVLSYRTAGKEQGTGLATVACTVALTRMIVVPLFVVATVTFLAKTLQTSRVKAMDMAQVQRCISLMQQLFEHNF